jgi:hypothetical protein
MEKFVEPEPNVVRILSREELLAANDSAVARDYNRTMKREVLEEELDPEGTSLVFPLLIHEHAQGKEVAPHMRCRVLMKLVDVREPQEAILDVPMGVYDAFRIVQKDTVNDEWIEPAAEVDEIIAWALGKPPRPPRGPYGTNEGDVWLGTDSDVGRLLAEKDGLTLIHEMMVRDDVLQDCVYTTADPELIARAQTGHEKWVADQAARQ